MAVQKMLNPSVALSLLFLVLSASGNTEHFVRSTSSTTCPAESPCLTLDDYVSNATEYFTSNTRFVFLDGWHYLNAALELESVTNITLSGIVTAVTIIVSENTSISYTSSQGIVMCSLEIAYKGGVENASKSALLFDNSHSVQITDIQFTGLIDERYRSRAIGFIQSTADIANCSFSDGYSDLGGAIYIDSSDITFSGVNSYTNNTADVSGGVIFATNSILVFNGANVFFKNADFTTGGEAMFISFTDLEFNGYVEFRENGPAALMAFDSTVSTKGQTLFINNLGGGTTFIRSNFSCTGEAHFVNNKRNGGSYGAALYAEMAVVSFSGNMSFINNTVAGGVGGAICAFDSTVHFLGEVLFANNEAEIGGGIYIERSKLLHLHGNVTYFNNTAGHKGGALYATNSSIRNLGLSNFIKNKADRGGGVVQYN